MSNRLYSEKPFWYTVPSACTADGWKEWKAATAKAYPFQFWLRDTVPHWYRCNIQCPVSNLYWKIFRIFKPCHESIRNAVPREWRDISDLIVTLNFAMITSFKKEADESFVDWDGTPEHRKFKDWLDAAATWINVDRPKQLEYCKTLYPPYPLPPESIGASYEELYGKLNEAEKKIDQLDTDILQQMIVYREHFWT